MKTQILAAIAAFAIIELLGFSAIWASGSMQRDLGTGVIVAVTHVVALFIAGLTFESTADILKK